MNEDEIIAWVKEEESILRSNEWNFIGGVQQFNEGNRVSTYVTSLKGIYDSINPQYEDTESNVDGVYSVEMKYSESLHLVPLIDFTKVDGGSDFDIITNKARRI